jgi:hypothetical protein
MPNYQSKGVDYMHELVRRGGQKSGETRRLKRAAKIIAQYAAERGMAFAPDPVTVL